MKLSDFSLYDERDEIVEREEMAAFLQRVNQTAFPYPSDKTVAGIFIEQATRTPDAIAVIYGDSRLSYQDIDRWSNQLAGFLVAQGLKPEDMVGLMLDSSPAAIVAMLGTLKAGGAYLPISPELPFERIKHMLRDSRAPVLISAQNQSETCRRLRVECPDLRHLLVVREQRDETLPGCAVEFEFEETALKTCAAATSVDRSRPNTLAYVMYTSGSTGQPKGVMIEHRAILRLVLNTNYISIGPGDCIAQAASIAFDAATFEIWGALLNGATVLLLSRDQLLDADLFARQLRERRFNILFLTTALFNRFARMDAKMFASLDYLLFGGEAVDGPRVIEVKEGGGAPHHLLHVYGPTESTTFATWYDVRDVGRDIPIGVPIGNTSVYILDEKLELAGIGVTGELCIGGDGLARGYLNDAALTAHKFIPHPLAAGERLYRTGDLARWRADGNIDFLSRKDDQVKVRGFRVEPGEIKTRLLQYGQIKEAIVLAKSDEEGDRRLIAYFSADTQVDLGGLRDHLAEILPDYMIPSFFVQMRQLPLTPNGKVDKSALPDPNQPTPAVGDSRDDLPTSQTEQTLLAIWREVLGQPTIGVNDNFFEHGGHSINAVKLMHLIHKRIGFALPFTLVFKAPTVRQLTQRILDAARFGKAEIDQPMVKLSAPEAGRAIFGFPPGTADALSYAGLVAHLQSYTFYAFNFIEHETRLVDYANVITDVEPDGPYLLFGYSGGGNLAFRTAQELESRGLRVSDVVMLDSSRFLEQFRFPAEEPRGLAANYLAEEGVRDYVTSQVLKDKALRIIEKYYDTLSSTQENEIINANIHVVVSENSQDSYHDESGRMICSKSAWGEVTRGKLSIYQGHGDHAHMLHGEYREPNSAILRDIFAACSNGA